MEFKKVVSSVLEWDMLINENIIEVLLDLDAEYMAS